MVVAGQAGPADEQRVQRPAERGQRSDGDQGVHGRGGVLQVPPRRAVIGQAAPDHDRCSQGEREPLRVRRVGRGLADRCNRLGGRQRGGVAGPLDGRDELVRGDRVRVRDGGLLGGVVDHGLHAVELVELALDPVGAGPARHAADDQVRSTLRGGANRNAHRAAPTITIRTRSVRPRCSLAGLPDRRSRPDEARAGVTVGGLGVREPDRSDALPREPTPTGGQHEHHGKGAEPGRDPGRRLDPQRSHDREP